MNFRFIISLLSSALILFSVIPCNTVAKSLTESAALREEQNKTIVRHYFLEILDQKQYSRMSEVLSPVVVKHRPEGTRTYVDTVQSVLEKALGRMQSRQPSTIWLHPANMFQCA